MYKLKDFDPNNPDFKAKSPEEQKNILKGIHDDGTPLPIEKLRQLTIPKYGHVSRHLKS